jgi:hypothetical protein
MPVMEVALSIISLSLFLSAGENLLLPTLLFAHSLPLLSHTMVICAQECFLNCCTFIYLLMLLPNESANYENCFQHNLNEMNMRKWQQRYHIDL